MQSAWVGTSTLWTCDGIPFGLAKMENAYQQKLSKSDNGQRIVETWAVAEFRFKNWKGNEFRRALPVLSGPQKEFNSKRPRTPKARYFTVYPVNAVD